jgi:hypothetical protein
MVGKTAAGFIGLVLAALAVYAARPQDSRTRRGTPFCPPVGGELASEQ